MPEEGYFTAEPVILTKDEMAELETEHIPPGVTVEVGYEHPKGHVVVESPVVLLRPPDGEVRAEARERFYRKYFTTPIGLAEYADLIQASVAHREQASGDVHLLLFDDSDDPCVTIEVAIEVEHWQALGAWENAQQVWDELLTPANTACLRVEKVLQEVSAAIPRIHATAPLTDLLRRVDSEQDPNEKGAVLEEVMLRLFRQIDGWRCRRDVRTRTEQIDISILNESVDPLWRQEGPLLLAECKNWSDKCGKNELVEFLEKIRNRRGRCRLGFLIS